MLFLRKGLPKCSDPAKIPQSATAPVSLKIVGDRLGTVTQVKLNNIPRPPANVSEKEITVSLTVADTATKGMIKVSVVGSNGESATKDLEIT